MQDTSPNQNRLVLFGALLMMAMFTGCDNRAFDANEEVAALDTYYADIVLPREWEVKSIEEYGRGDLVVEVEIGAAKHARFIKSKSRMAQFRIAKLACPTHVPNLRDAFRKGTRVWVRLVADREELATSICPLTYA
ncbi:hypothetical protein ACFL12_03395 [Pseudomonadota bacterium]